MWWFLTLEYTNSLKNKILKLRELVDANIMKFAEF